MRARCLRDCVRATLAGLLGLAAVPAAAQPPLAPAGLPRVELRLQRARGEARAAEGLPIVVTLRRGDLPAAGAARRAGLALRLGRVLGDLAPGSFEPRRRFETLGGFAGRAQPAAIDRLIRHPEVESVYLDGVVRPTLAEGAALIGADEVHARGYTGAGVNVALIDTGIDTDHEYLADDLVAEHCFCGGCCTGGASELSGPGSAEDVEGHGTSVAGIVTSSYPSAPGVAPDAGIVAVRVFGMDDEGSFSDVASALEWVYDNRALYDIRLVNLSLGDGGEYDNPNSFLCRYTATARAIQDLYAVDVAVFVSSGNEGHDFGVSFPACVAEAIAVGGVYDQGFFGTVAWAACSDASPPEDSFVCHTNSGSLLDLLAPDWQTLTTRKDGGNVNFGGTSGAAPYAAAQAALLLEADPGLGAAALASLLTGSGPLVSKPAPNPLSFPRADVAAALDALIGPVDSDADGVADDGDDSGIVGDFPCTGGATLDCDDNCLLTPNPGQQDLDSNGIGDACQPVPVPALSPLGGALLVLGLAALRWRRSGRSAA